MMKEGKTLVKEQSPVSNGQSIDQDRKRGLVINAIQRRRNQVISLLKRGNSHKKSTNKDNIQKPQEVLNNHKLILQCMLQERFV